MNRKTITFLCLSLVLTTQFAYAQGLEIVSTNDICRHLKNESASGVQSLISQSESKKFSLADQNIQFCSYSGENLKTINESWAEQNTIVAYKPQIQFEDTVELIRAYSRNRSNYDVMFASIPNAMAVSQKQDNEVKRFVLYNWRYLCAIQSHTKSNWADDSVFAHEVGHHLPNHILRGGSRPYFELQADWFSGYILQRMGAPLDEATIVLRTTQEHQRKNLKEQEIPNSLTHPLLEDRIAAVSEGWTTACDLDPKCELMDP